MRRTATFVISICAALLGAHATAQPENSTGLPKPWTGTVTKIVDGDGIYVEGSEYQIRLFGVDAPAAREVGFAEATATLEKLVAGKTVRVVPQYWNPATGPYRARIVGRVWIGSVEVNNRVIEIGPATEHCDFSNGLYGHC